MADDMAVKEATSNEPRRTGGSFRRRTLFSILLAALDEDFIYWADSGTGQILRGAIDGSSMVEVLYDPAHYPSSPTAVYPQWLAIVPDPVPEPSSLVMALVIVFVTYCRCRAA